MKRKINRKTWWMTGKCHNKDCGKPISFDAAYCSSCAKKGSNSNRYNEGISLKKYFCACGQEISYQTAVYGKGSCKKCGYIVLRNQHKKRSSECREKMRQAKLGKFGKLANNWIDGSSFEPYPLGWTKTFKEQIRKRDKHRCRRCGCKENGRKLDIHHIDYNKENLSPENLISLCHTCHMRTNGDRKFWKRFFKELTYGNF